MDISEQSVRAHYGELLGVGQQWEVERVELNRVEHRIEAWAVWCQDEALMCPQCRETCPGYDHLPLRT